MTQPLDFSNQDLRDRSFKGQNLAGANFRKADIRGCDFSKANLEGEDFSGVIAGQSSKQIFIAVAVAFADSTLITFTDSFFRITSKTVLIVTFVLFLCFLCFGLAFGFTAVFMVVLIFAFLLLAFGFVLMSLFTSIFAVAIVAMLAFMFVLASAEFAKGNILGVLAYSSIILLLLVLSYVILQQAIEKIRNMTGTSFKSTTLTKSRFIGAILKNCDFTDAKLYQTDWTHAHFTRYKFSDILAHQKVRELCISRIGANEDFSSSALSGLNLIGVNLRDANLSGANLNSTNLTQSNLENANLSKVQAIQTDFTKAYLSGACIENWAITSETIFSDAICTHIYLESFQRERKPASGSLKQGDFAKLITQSTKSLDFFFHNGIDSKAFDFALNNLIEDYEEMGISLKGVDDLGGGDKLVRFNTVPDAPKAEMHVQFTQDYEEMRQQLEASRNRIWELQQKLDRIDLETDVTWKENKVK